MNPRVQVQRNRLFTEGNGSFLWEEGKSANSGNMKERELREELFRAICQDSVRRVRELCRNLDSIDEYVFGVLFHLVPSETRKNNLKKEFVAYGAQSLNSRNCKRKGASILHLAANKNSIRVAKFCLQMGASVSKKDCCGNTALERATAEEMRMLLRRPPAPRKLFVVHYTSNYALLEWTVPFSRSTIDLFELHDLEHDSVIISIDAVDQGLTHYMLGTDRESDVAFTYETPDGLIHSRRSMRFAIRYRNNLGFWSDWCEMKTSVQAKHWSIDVDVRAEEEKKSERLNKFKEGKRALIVGSRNFGLVREEEWFQKAQEEQQRAATLIQSIARAFQRQKEYRELNWIRRNYLRRSGATRIIQRFFRAQLLKRKKKRHAVVQSFASESERKHSKTRRSYECILKQERARLRIMRQLERGHAILSARLHPWK